GRAVIRLNLSVAVLSFEQADWLPLMVLEAGVDARGFLDEFPIQIVIAFDRCPAGRRQLDKRKFADIRGVIDQKLLDRTESFKDSLRVIDAVHADTHPSGFHP